MSRPLAYRFIVLVFVLLIIPESAVVLAQDKAVEGIKRLYQEIGAKIELSEKGSEDSQVAGIFCSELAVNKNNHIWPVVGTYEMTYRFYYDLAHTEGHPYPDRLRKVVMKSSMSARSYYSEYLFDEAGALVFFFTKPNEPPIGDEPQRLEQRIYFTSGRPIRVIDGQRTRDSLTTKDLQFAKEIIKTSRDIKLFFAKSLDLPNG
jgi:hypothetical protein